MMGWMSTWWIPGAILLGMATWALFSGHGPWRLRHRRPGAVLDRRHATEPLPTGNLKKETP
jgi:hypothetical protein